MNYLFEIVVTVLGTLLLSYFKEMKNDVKNMSSSMIEMNTKLTTVITKHDNTAEKATKNEGEIDRIRERLHKVEGGQAQLVHFIDTENQARGN